MNSKIRILFITSSLSAGGKERQLFELLKGLNKSTFTIGIIVFNDNQHYTKSVSEGVDYFKVLNKRPTRFEPLFNIWDCYKNFKPDIVHSWDSLSSFYSYFPSRFYKVKIIDGSIRDAGVDKGFYKVSKSFFLKRSDIIIANSYAGLNAYKVKGYVIYNSIDIKRFYNYKKAKGFNIIMVANFSNYKDHGTFINASVQLLKMKAVDKVYLLGEGPNKRKFINYVFGNYPEISDNIIFTGLVSNVEDFLSRCSIGVLCSTLKYSEGVSNSVLEYMAAGLVPIVTNIGGSSEIIENELNGFLINPEDSRRIIELVNLIKNNGQLRDCIVKNAKKTINEKFNSIKNIRKLECIYEEAVKKD